MGDIQDAEYMSQEDARERLNSGGFVAGNFNSCVIVMLNEINTNLCRLANALEGKGAKAPAKKKKAAPKKKVAKAKAKVKRKARGR